MNSRIILTTAFLFLSVVSIPAQLQLILDTPTLARPGGSFSVPGRVANNTGSDLKGSDLFLNFSNIDSNITDVTQLLGIPDFDLPNNTFTGDIPLFEGEISPSALDGRYSLDVSLEDINNNLSPTMTVHVTVSTVPEQSQLGMLISVLIAFFAVSRIWKVRQNQVTPTQKHANT
jgi:hypothetical protein